VQRERAALDQGECAQGSNEKNDVLAWRARLWVWWVRGGRRPAHGDPAPGIGGEPGDDQAQPGLRVLVAA
jgi:hypothetical protein